MPKVVQIGSRVLGGSTHIMNRVDCAIRIAAVLLEWAMVEHYLSSLLSSAMGTNSVNEAGGISVSQDRNSMIIMEEIDSIHKRLQIIDRLLLRYLNPSLAEEWTAVKSKIKSGAKKRNFCAHTAWAFHDNYPNDLLFRTDEGIDLCYEPKDFDDMLQHLKETLHATSSLEAKILLAIRNGEIRIDR
jgi:hypothetical protein